MLHQTRESLIATLGAQSDAFIMLLEQPQAELPPRASTDYLLVEITLFPGRSDDCKRAAYEALRTLFHDIGLRPEEISLVYIESRSENWFQG
ncbi:MAG: tautomerase family protein [Shinella sp.]|uniref:tautomerase family protein n=1 Tax=Shinella sp. TaxID=1870904 RepID=UPI004037232D